MVFLKLEEERIFEADLSQVPLIVSWIEELGERVGLHPRRQQHLALSAEEAVVNICSYAYEVPPGEISVRVFSDGESCRISFRDKGVPFDPLSLKDPKLDQGLEERAVGGLGILLMRRVMDEVHYMRKKGENILSLTIHAPDEVPHE